MYLHKDRVRAGQDLGLIYLSTELKLLSCHHVESPLYQYLRRKKSVVNGLKF